jgi:hypothetical protein
LPARCKAGTLAAAENPLDRLHIELCEYADDKLPQHQRTAIQCLRAANESIKEELLAGGSIQGASMRTCKGTQTA